MFTFTTSTHLVALSSTTLNLRNSTSSSHLPSQTFPASPLFSQPLLPTTRYLTPTLSPPQDHSIPRQASLTHPQRLQIDSPALRATRGSSAVPMPLFTRVDGGKAALISLVLPYGGAAPPKLTVQLCEQREASSAAIVLLFTRVDGGKASCSILIVSASEARACGAGLWVWRPDTE